MRKHLNSKSLRVATFMAAIAIAVLVVLALRPGASHASGPKAAVSSSQGSTLASSFSLLDSAPPQTVPPAVSQAVHTAPPSYGLDLDAARQSPGTDVWLIPGEEQLCVATDDAEGFGMSCASASQAEDGHLALVVHSSIEDAVTVIGAAPDGSTSATGEGEGNEALASAPVRQNTYVIEGTGLQRIVLSPAAGTTALEVGP
jgi:hypothetical protein